MPGTVFSLWTWHQVKPAYRCCPERHGSKSANKMPLTMLNDREGSVLVFSPLLST